VTKAAHLSKAQANETFRATFDTNSASGLEWSITVAFYAAVHYVQAYFASKGQTYMSHKLRDSAIQRDVSVRAIYSDYRALEDWSRDARYEHGGFIQGNLIYIRDRLDAVKRVIIPLL